MTSITTPSGLVIEDLEVGTGAEAVAGQKVTVHYTGWLTNGTKFDSSKDRRDPFSFPLGMRHVIAGWDERLVGRTVGSRVILEIPPAKGYGKQGNEAAGIKGTDTLFFVVDILGAS